MIEILQSILPVGGTFIDVGANKGFFTLMSRQIIGPTGRIIAYEPVPDNFADICETVEANGWENVTVVQKAMADKAGQGHLKLVGFDQGHSGWSYLSDTSDETTIEVSAAALDEELLALGIKWVDVVKIDVEGAELLVLKGFTQFLKEGLVGRLLLEIHASRLGVAGTLETLELLTSHNYVAEYLGRPGEAFAEWLETDTKAPIPDSLLPGGRVHVVFGRQDW